MIKKQPNYFSLLCFSTASNNFPQRYKTIFKYFHKQGDNLLKTQFINLDYAYHSLVIEKRLPKNLAKATLMRSHIFKENIV